MWYEPSEIEFKKIALGKHFVKFLMYLSRYAMHLNSYPYPTCTRILDNLKSSDST